MLASLAAVGPDAVCALIGLGVAGLVIALDRRRQRAPRVVVTAPVVPSGARRLPVIDAARCLGCQACVNACPYDALAVTRYVALLVRPDACCGAGPCQESCPNGSLVLVAGSSEQSGPELSAELESRDKPGIFLAGDVTGGALVKNALRQGVSVARAVRARIERSGDAGHHGPGAETVELVVVGAGPAGLAAALTSAQLGVRTLVLEQARLAASIQSFSRDKLVLDAPSTADEQLPLFVGDARKEELVSRWQRTVRSARLDVREGTRVLGVLADGAGAFLVKAELSDGTLLEQRAKYVLLATGTRGTPRELSAPVAEAARSRVHYELSDARAFSGKRVVIVGLGDVAMESALALATQSGVSITVLHRGSGFRRGKQRNIDALSSLVAQGKVLLVLDAHVERVAESHVAVRVAGIHRSLSYDALFVHVGRVVAHALLEQAGVCQPKAERVGVGVWDSAQRDRPSS